ncbi:MAG: hypothetical protein A2496_14390 [Burkholderiales bacterium RIFOXYC12_FULL_60_6]|nr:MAG: hypothetical protein A2496_14390 [Burkholderiales bacterium RIFOXYC12_FULL_60_6]
MEKQVVTLSELIKRKASEQPEDYLEYDVIPAGTEYVPRFGTTRVIHETRVVHQHEIGKKSNGKLKTTKLFLKDSLLFKQGKKEEGFRLVPNLKNALVILMDRHPDFVKTPQLIRTAGYKKLNTFHSNKHRLDVWSRKAGIKGSILMGRSGDGYALSPDISIQEVRSVTK